MLGGGVGSDGSSPKMPGPGRDRALEVGPGKRSRKIGTAQNQQIFLQILQSKL